MTKQTTTRRKRPLSPEDIQFYRDYGLRLRVTRHALGITEDEAAAAHGITLKTYQKWEAGGWQRGGTSMRARSRQRRSTRFSD